MVTQFSAIIADSYRVLIFVANLRGDMIKCYHHECDNLEVMLTDDNLQFLGKTVDAITTTLHSLSGPGTCILSE